MSITFSKLLTDCLIALGDPMASVFSRVDVVWPWAIEAMLSFPILRPMLDEHTVAGSATHSYALPADFREVISVEYPISQTPPSYLARKNRLDDSFYDASGYYDIDHDYVSGSGFYLYSSGLLAVDDVIKVQYLANHDTDMQDDDTVLITVPDEWENILVAYVVAKAYRQRLGIYMVDPTAHTSIVYQMTEMVKKAEENYHSLVLRAQQKLADSKITPNVQSDKFDRVY